MDGEGRRSKEAVRNSIRTYGVKVMDPASLPLKKTRETESRESVSRFSEKSLHSHYEIREGFLKSCLNRVPYATLLATIVCLLGVVIFAAAGQRGAVLTSNMINDVLREDATAVKTYDIAFLAVEVVTAAVAIMILIIGILATGDTRAKIYSAWKARVGGRLCCAFVSIGVCLMILSLILLLVWLLTFWFYAMLVYLVIISKIECDLYTELLDDKKCLHLPILNIFSPTQKKDIKICDEPTIKKFCKDYVEKVSPAYVMTSFAAFLIIFGLVLYLICLAANYARIRCQAKFQELEELRHLEGDVHNSKDRF